MKRWLHNIIFAGMIILPLVVSAQSSKEQLTKIAAIETPYLLHYEANKQGIYNQIFSAFAQELQQKVELLYSPPYRALTAFVEHQTACLFPANVKSLPEELKVISSEPVLYATAYIFNRNDEPVITGLEQLAGRSLATRRGYNYGKTEFGNDIQIVPLTNIRQSVQMLLKKRVDAFIAYEPDVLAVFEQLHEHGMHRADDFFVHRQAETVVCHQTAENEKFIALFNQQLAQIKQTENMNKLARFE